MATYQKEATRGRTLHLLKLDKPFGETTVYLNATRNVKEAEKADTEAGYKGPGPSVAFEIEKAREYADYVESVATLDNLHQFNCQGYELFTDKTMPQPRKTRRAPQKTDVRTNVPA